MNLLRRKRIDTGEIQENWQPKLYGRLIALTLLIAYSIGLGVPFLLSGLALDRLSGAFGWVKRHFPFIIGTVVTSIVAVSRGPIFPSSVTSHVVLSFLARNVFG